MLRSGFFGVNGVFSVPSENDIHAAASPCALCQVSGEPQSGQKLRVTPGDDSRRFTSSAPRVKAKRSTGTLP